MRQVQYTKAISQFLQSNPTDEDLVKVMQRRHSPISHEAATRELICRRAERGANVYNTDFVLEYGDRESVDEFAAKLMRECDGQENKYGLGWVLIEIIRHCDTHRDAAWNQMLAEVYPCRYNGSYGGDNDIHIRAVLDSVGPIRERYGRELVAQAEKRTIMWDANALCLLERVESLRDISLSMRHILSLSHPRLSDASLFLIFDYLLPYRKMAWAQYIKRHANATYSLVSQLEAMQEEQHIVKYSDAVRERIAVELARLREIEATLNPSVSKSEARVMMERWGII